MIDKIPLIIDIASVFIFLIIVYKSYKLGFLRAVVQLVGYVASLFAALFLSVQIRDWLYNNIIRVKIISSVEGIAESASSSAASSIVPFFMDSLPQVFFRPLVTKSFGSEEEIISYLEKTVDSAALSLGEIIADDIIGPIVSFCMTALFFVIIFIICIVIVNLISTLFKRFYAIPILGTLNSLLGGVIGLLKAPVILVVIGAIASLICTYSANEIDWFNSGLIEQTVIFKQFVIFASNL